MTNIVYFYLQDALLTEGVELYKKDEGRFMGWSRVAEHVGGGVTAQQCMDRWNGYLGKVQQADIKLGDWADEEVNFCVLASIFYSKPT